MVSELIAKQISSNLSKEKLTPGGDAGKPKEQTMVLPQLTDFQSSNVDGGIAKKAKSKKTSGGPGYTKAKAHCDEVIGKGISPRDNLDELEADWRKTAGGEPTDRSL